MKLKIVTLITLVSFAACNSNDLAVLPVEGTLNTPAIGKEEQAIVFQISPEQNLNVHILKIEESRCPSDVQCISTGYAKVVFKVDDIGETELITPKFAGSNAAQIFEFTYASQKYRLTLTDVSPYPTTENYEEAKSAEFLLEAI